MACHDVECIHMTVWDMFTIRNILTRNMLQLGTILYFEHVLHENMFMSRILNLLCL